MTGVRVAVLSLGFIWLMLGPIANQVYRFKVSWLPQWTMFRGHGREVWDVRFYAVESGQRRRLNRFESLQDPESGELPSWAKTVNTERRAEWVGRALCETLGVESPDVRVVIRKGSQHGWSAPTGDETNICVTGALPPRRSR